MATPGGSSRRASPAAAPGSSVTARSSSIGASTAAGSAGPATASDCFSSLVLVDIPLDRCIALCDQLLQPLPVPPRSPALCALRRQVAGHLLRMLGGRLERVLESLAACKRWAALPYSGEGGVVLAGWLGTGWCCLAGWLGAGRCRLAGSWGLHLQSVWGRRSWWLGPGIGGGELISSFAAHPR